MSEAAALQIRVLDAMALADLLSLYAHLHEADDPLPAGPQVEAVWHELLANPRYHYWGGYVGGELVASCNLTVIPNLTRGCRPYGLIENVVTHAAHRGKGYGKAMLAEALAFAWTQHCYKVMLMTGRKDDATLNFYATAGFDAKGKQAFIAKPPANPD